MVEKKKKSKIWSAKKKSNKNEVVKRKKTTCSIVEYLTTYLEKVHNLSSHFTCFEMDHVPRRPSISFHSSLSSSFLRSNFLSLFPTGFSQLQLQPRLNIETVSLLIAFSLCILLLLYLSYLLVRVSVLSYSYVICFLLSQNKLILACFFSNYFSINLYTFQLLLHITA